MINWGRWLIRLLIMVLVILAENVVGIPIFSIILSSMFSQRLPRSWRLGLMVSVGLVMAAVYMVPLSQVVLVLGVCFLWLRYGKEVVASKFIRLVSTGVLGSLILLILNSWHLRWQYGVYLLMISLVSFSILKRHKLRAS